ncbi:DsrE/DsrF/DrsH-like family protein [Candidatus Acetothermia bacterium]|jgi:peroxiredoxin family protein|nr:DsrE/DsrF/DrsH-like family protein [Candidatus Acetothermia bacterium]MCI2431760.1 DsrE/DsrF/DrsH-like family protein [Candidatus Acetothermia bacterium]MCI2436756.1 DsrE/DsrF/DrsH-like family protein [Candidatus Acetothermia bacterium]
MTSKQIQTELKANGRGLEERLAALEAKLATIEERLPEDRVSLVVFSGDLDRVLAAFVIATGAAALGQNVSIFFTFWGLNALKKKRVLSGKRLMEKMMALMSPSGSRSLPVSKMNFFGVGAKMLRTMMREKNVSSLEDLMQMARDLGVRIVACEMSRDVMGIKDEELIGGLECGGVASFLADALKSRATLFI